MTRERSFGSHSQHASLQRKDTIPLDNTNESPGDGQKASGKDKPPPIVFRTVHITTTSVRQMVMVEQRQGDLLLDCKIVSDVSGQPYYYFNIIV